MHNLILYLASFQMKLEYSEHTAVIIDALGPLLSEIKKNQIYKPLRQSSF